MTRYTLLATVFTASVALGGAAYAADQAATTAASHETAIQKDVGKLSADGAKGFRDLHLARIAIFDADPAQAKTLVHDAQAVLAKAKTDESVFTKAEADLKPPAAAKAMPAKGTGVGDMKQPVAWLPVDGQLLLDEDFVATPQKAAAVADANKNLEKGDRKGAAEKLKLAGVNVNFTMAVVPLAKTTADVDQAAALLDQGKYYEANAALKQAEDGVRFDVIDATSLPQASKAAGASAKANVTEPTGTGTAKPAH
ncbi:YfdX family protein [Methylobacterium sp. E-016]|uniref:YfdX family protein n=1 Tax=Methylobacterium sp. E-016 TaxID=2836556 RepID=UPI001FBA718D|nr:YfdX family protein [Methylobacterium sp. E-016]MCJ2077708.1 YfdX family protein [Methylobacterium sp. E-016]